MIARPDCNSVCSQDILWEYLPRKLGCEHHLLVVERGLTLVAWISGAQLPDSRFLMRLVDSIPAVNGLAGRARKRPVTLHADRAYASKAHRAWLPSRGA